MAISTTIPLLTSTPGRCPTCQRALSYAGGGLQDEQYRYDWDCAGCGASGREWYELTFVGQQLHGQPEPAVSPARCGRYTVIGEYWDNEQAYCAHVMGADEDAAIELAQAQCAEQLQAEEPLEETDQQPLRIWAVLRGWVEVSYLKSAEG